MDMPLISVIVPVYNAEKYLDRCIESIVSQTYKNLEIILVDDGSPDNCPQMCDEWAKKDSRIKVIHKENGGAAAARNTGLDNATGDYIGFADSDDLIEADMYEYLFNLASENNADIAMCDYQINAQDRGTDETVLKSSYEVLEALPLGDYFYGVLWNKLYKKSAVKDLKMPPLKYSEDLVFNYFAVKNSEKIAISTLKLYHYLQNYESAVHSRFDLSNLDAVKAREIMLNDADSRIKKYAVSGYLLSCYVCLNECLKNTDYIQTAYQMRKNILKYKKDVLFSKNYSFKDKLKIILLSLGVSVYKKFL